MYKSGIKQCTTIIKSVASKRGRYKYKVTEENNKKKTELLILLGVKKSINLVHTRFVY